MQLMASGVPGIFAMVAGVAFLIFIHELGHWLVARMLGFKTPVFSVGFGKREHSLILGKLWETEFRLSPIPLGGYVSIPELQDESTIETVNRSGHTNNFKVFPPWKRISVAVAGVVTNIAFAIITIAALIAFIGKPSFEVTSVSIDNLSPEVKIASQAGLKTGDRFVSVAGRAIKTPEDLIDTLRARKSEPVEIVVKRLTEYVTVTITPNQFGQIGLDSVTPEGVEKHTRLAPRQALSEGISSSFASMYDMLKGIGMMLGQVEPPPNLPAGATDVHGIVSIVSIGQQAYDQGTFAFIWLLAMISLNLAIMNVLPFPPLDGGHVLFFSIEWICRKPVPLGIRSKLTQVFFLLFVVITLYGLFNDIFKPIKLG